MGGEHATRRSALTSTTKRHNSNDGDDDNGPGEDDHDNRTSAFVTGLGGRAPRRPLPAARRPPPHALVARGLPSPRKRSTPAPPARAFVRASACLPVPPSRPGVADSGTQCPGESNPPKHKTKCMATSYVCMHLRANTCKYIQAASHPLPRRRPNGISASGARTLVTEATPEPSRSQRRSLLAEFIPPAPA